MKLLDRQIQRGSHVRETVDVDGLAQLSEIGDRLPFTDTRR